MPQLFMLAAAASLVFLTSMTVTESVQAQSRMTCKLESQRVIQGRERQCIYRCPDGSIEGRTRRLNQECLSTVQAAND